METDKLKRRNPSSWLDSGSGWNDIGGNSKKKKNRDNSSTMNHSPASKSTNRQTNSRPKAKIDPTKDKGYKYHEVVRGKKAREELDGYDCDKCKGFFSAVLSGKGAKVFERKNLICDCSRHRSKFSPDNTPDGFWEMSFLDERRERELPKQKVKGLQESRFSLEKQYRHDFSPSLKLNLLKGETKNSDGMEQSIASRLQERRVSHNACQRLSQDHDLSQKDSQDIGGIEQSMAY